MRNDDRCRTHGTDAGSCQIQGNFDPGSECVLGPVILRYFVYDHLPEHLQRYSKPFADLAWEIVEMTPRNAEQSTALRKLLEAKDAAVRAAL